jgi:hypothetical protein
VIDPEYVWPSEITVGEEHVSLGTVGQPSFVVPSQSSSQVFPQTSDGAQQAPQEQPPLQVCVPATPQELLHDIVDPGSHAPPPTQVLHEPHVQADPQVRDCDPVPHQPQLCVSVAPRQQAQPLSQPETQSSSAPLQVSAGGTHAPQVQLGEQVCVPVELHEVVQLWVAPGVHAPEAQPLHAPQVQLGEQVRLSVPPQAQLRVSVVPGEQTPSPPQALHEPQEQAVPQVRLCVPQKPQLCVCVWPRQHSQPLSQPETQSSSNPLHVSAGGAHGPQVQLGEQTWVPVEPQPVVQLRVALGVHSPEAQPLQAPQMQSPPQVRFSVPPQVQLRVSVAPGEHSPPPMQVPHEPQVQPAEQVRVWLAHRPQLWVCVWPRQHSEPLSQPSTQSSSSPLQVSAGGTQEPQAQAAEQVWVPVDPQEVEQSWTSSGVHAPSVQPLQAPQVQEEEQMRFSEPPQRQPRVSVVPAAHSPLPPHVLHAPQAQPEAQVRVCVPQKPQPCSCVAPRQHSQPLSHPERQSSSKPLQVSAGGTQAAQLQVLEQVWVPAEPQVVLQDMVVPRTQV